MASSWCSRRPGRFCFVLGTQVHLTHSFRGVTTPPHPGRVIWEGVFLFSKPHCMTKILSSLEEGGGVRKDSRFSKKTLHNT